jgi:potassium uptake TrkH family protein
VKLQSLLNERKKRARLGKLVDNLLFVLAVVGFVAVFIDVGDTSGYQRALFNTFFQVCLFFFIILFGLQAVLKHYAPAGNREKWFAIILVILLEILLLAQLNFDFGLFEVFSSQEYLQLAIIFIFIIEIVQRSLALEKLKVNPPLLFIFSFLVLIILGAFTLMLPISSKVQMHFVDALFTSTSAVCVTGLTVLDTGIDFTRFGQNVILTLISLGGLGVMTFTSFFALFFRGESSFQNQMIYKDFTGEENMKKVFTTIVRIVTFTIGIELFGTAILFFSLSPSNFTSFGERLYFSAFHAISAFNNAGFQLKTAGLYDPITRHNHVFQSVIAVLVIFGGIGFYIAFNVVKYLREISKAKIRKIILDEPTRYAPWIINMNTRVVAITTLILLTGGTIIFYITDYNQALSDHEGFGKWLSAFFLSVTPRTAGFNNIDMAALSREGILITLLLMWVGGSPGSTAGGVKTSTVAIAILGIYNIAKGRDHIEIGHREVAKESLLRAFIVIFLSLIVLTLSIMFLEYFEPDVRLMNIVFECFSALGTVGLSLGITASLSDTSKLILVITMFAGRVGMLTILFSLLRKATDNKTYRYPVENIIIN